MATIITADACENHITPASGSEPQPDAKKNHKSTLEAPPALKSQDSISVRRQRGLTAFLFEEIAGQKLKCYEKWKLWLGLFICMTVVAVVAIAFASYYAVKVDAYESKTDAVDAQSDLIYNIVHDPTANFSDHTDETRKIFNTFDDNADGAWNRREFYDHFILGASATVFDGIDENGDNILSWSEIASSISKHSLSQSYIAPVREMYNYTFANATDPVLNNYAANVYLAYYNIEEFGYITRARFYEYRANTSFTHTDMDRDNSISFAEFSRKIGNDEMISFLREWNVESYLQSLTQTGVQDGDPISTGASAATAANMCPYTAARRRLSAADNIDVYFTRGGDLIYEYDNGGCEATLTCTNTEGRGRTNKIDDVCALEELEQLVECMVVVIDRYLAGAKLIKCQKETAKCFEEHAAVISEECNNDGITCECECSEECRDHIPYRRLGSDCGGSACACGGDCTCFSGENQMWIKREDRVENIALKDLKIGDYAQTKGGEWSKVWFIKAEEASAYEFLKLYFDEEEYITMTSHHLLYVDDITEASMKRADQVAVGDIVFVIQNATSFGLVEKEIVRIESTISADGAYAPVTMEGSIVVNQVVSSCYVESAAKAQRLHDTAAVFRWISSYNTNLGSFMTHLFYDTLFMKLRTNYGLDAAHVVFNAYSMPCIVIVTVNVAMFGLIRSFSSFL